jgi:hypothetical protein
MFDIIMGVRRRGVGWAKVVCFKNFLRKIVSLWGKTVTSNMGTSKKTTGTSRKNNGNIENNIKNGNIENNTSKPVMLLGT